MGRIPRAGGDEVRQRLPVAVLAKTGRHRLHRLASPVQQQSPHVCLPPPPLIRPEEPVEQLPSARLQVLPDPSQLLRCHTSADTPLTSEDDQALLGVVVKVAGLANRRSAVVLPRCFEPLRLMDLWVPLPLGRDTRGLGQLARGGAWSDFQLSPFAHDRRTPPA